MLNIEKYRARLGNYSESLDCDIQEIKEKYKEKNDSVVQSHVMNAEKKISNGFYQNTKS